MGDVENLEQLFQINWLYVVAAIYLLVHVIKNLWSGVDWFAGKFGIETKRMRKAREESESLKKVIELATKTAENLDKLQTRHTKDEEEFRDSLNNYMKESREDRKALHDEMTKFSNNRIDDRKQSLKIQKELKDSISERDTKIEALVIANKEMLAEEINKKYKYYISINGIPEDEYDEFVSLHAAYKGVGGNSHGDAKFEYCITHLPIIPVDTKLVIKHED